MLRPLISTPDRAAPLIARLTLGAIMLPHGAQHALGWFGGYGFAGTLGWMTGTLGFPAPAAALGIIGLMLGALSTHTAHGFFMNWFGALPAGAEGFEYHLLVIALAAVVAIAGSGAHSVDGRLSRSA